MAKKKTIKYLENGEYHDATVKDVGVIEELKTESKDNLVEAINEIFLGGGKGFSDLQQKVDESTQAAQNAQQAANNLQQKLDEVAQNVGLSDEEVQKIINQAVEDAKRAQAEALQAYKDAQKELDDSMAQFMEEQKAINKELEQAKADIQGDIDQKNAEIEQINAVIESTKSDLTATSARLASVRNDLSNAQMDWGKVRQEITNINGKLDSKMSNTDFDEYKERIERNETEITQTKNELQSKATKQDLDVLTGTVTTQGSSITQLAGKIEQKVSKDTLANDIDDFQVKKANIFTGTREFMGWEFSDKALGRVNDDIYNHAKVAELHNGSNLSITVNGLEVGKTYSVSIFAKASANSNTSGIKVTVDNGKSYSGLMRTVYTPHDTKVTTNWQRYYATIVASATTMKFVFDRSGITSDITLYLNRPKLEVGETVYAWEDNAQDIYKRVEHTEAQFDVYNDQISGIVKRQTETDKKIENVSSTFTQRADGIEANAKKYTNDKVAGLTEEFSGRLKATSQELSTEYEKQTNAKIGALSDGGSNLILNSSFLVTDNNGNATLENWIDISSKVSLTTISDKGSVKGLDGTWLKSGKATSGNGTGLGARTNYFPVKQGKLVVGVDVVLDAMGRPYNGSISPYILRIEYYDASNNRVNYEDVTLQKLGLTEKDVVRVGLFENYKYARGVYKTSNDRSDVAKACIVVPETITGYNMYLTNFFAKFSDVNDGTYEVNPLDQQASLIKQRTKIEQDSEKINLLNTQTEKLGNDIKATNTSVNVLKGEVDLKASQSTVNDLTNRVAKNAADIKVFPDKIKSEVSEVSKKIDGVNDKVDNIKVGGTNLVRNSAHDPSGLEHWITNGVGKIWYGTHSFFRNGTTKMFFLNNPNTNQEMLIQTEYIDIEPDTDYTLSMVVFGASGVSSGDVYYNIKYADGSNTYFNVDRAFKYNPYRAERKAYKFHTSPNSSGSKATQIFIRVDNNGLIPGYSDGTSMLGDVKLEKGTIATDWSPAPEDTDASIESAKSIATQTKDGFERLAQKTGYNASTGEFSKVTTQINEGIKGVSSEVKSVSNRLDNLSVGGTNLVRNGACNSNDTSHWSTNGRGKLYVLKHAFVKNGSVNHFGLENNTSDEMIIYSDWIDVQPNTDYTLSYYRYGYSSVSSGDTYIQFKHGDGTTRWQGMETKYKFNPSYAEYKKFTFRTDDSDKQLQVRFDNNGGGTAMFAAIKLEQGVIATDWSPAPEDLQEGIDIATTKATQTKDGFERLAQKTGYNASTGEFSKVTTQINEGIKGVSSEVKSVSNRLDNLSVGGTNLVRNGACNSNDTSHWSTNGRGKLYVLKHAFVKNGSVNHFGLENNTSDEMIIYSDWIDVQPNTDYTLSYYRYGYSSVSSGDTYIQFKHGDGTTRWQGMETKYKFNPSYAEYKKFTFRTDDSDKQLQVRFDNNGGGTAMFAAIKLEQGVIATDWSPAPEDLQEGIDIATTKATQTNTKFEHMISQIQYNDSTGEIGKYEHKITELANGTQEKISAIRTDSDKKLQSATQTLTNKIGDLERTVRTNTTNLGQYRQEMTNSAQELSLKLTNYQNLVLNDISGVKNNLNNMGQTNLYYNSEFTYTGTDPHNMDGIQSTRNVAYSKNDKWSSYKGSNAVFALTRGTLNDYYFIEHRKDKYVKVQPGEVVSASVVTWVTGGSDVPRDGYAICTISFYKDLSSSRMGYKETSVAAKDINYPYYRTLKVENVTVPDGANYMILHLIIRGSSNWQFSQPMLVKDSQVGAYVPSTQLQLNQVADKTNSNTDKIGILQGQITATANKFSSVYTKTDVDNKLSPINKRTEFLQDNSQFLLRVQQAGAATGGVNNLLTNSDTFDGYSENNTNNIDFQKIEGSGLPAVPNQPSITMMGHVWDNYGSVYNKNDGIYLENGETYWFGVYLMTDSNAGAFRNLSVYASLDKSQIIGGSNKSYADEAIGFNKHFGGKTKTWKWNTFKLTGDGTTRYNWRIEPYNHIGGSIWTAGYMLVKSPFPPTGWSPNMTDVQMRLDSGGVTINGNTTINGELEAKEIVMKATNGAKLKLNAQGLNMGTYNGAQLNLGTDKMELISPYYSNYNPLSWRTVIDDKGLGITEAQFGYDNTLKYYNEIQGYVGPGYANRVDGDLPERINSGIEIGLMPFKAYGGDKQDKTKEIYGGDYIAIGEYHKDDKLMKKRKMNAGYVFLTYDDDVYDMKIFSDNDKPNPRQGNNLIGNTTFMPFGIEGGIAVTWTNWSDWTGKIPAVMRYDGPGKWLGCIAFGGDGNVILSGGGKRWNLLGH